MSLLLGLASGCRDRAPPPTVEHSRGASPLDGAKPAESAEADPGDWPMSGKDYRNTRFTKLADVNAGNVSQLRIAFMFSMGTTRGQEAAPLVVNGTMFLVGPYPNEVYALDLTKPDDPVKWSYRPPTVPSSQGVACCDVVNRGAAYSNGRVFFNTLDDHTVALDADNGHVLWNAQLGSINKGETMTMAPLVVGDKVLVGNSGGELGVRGWLTALDAATGKIAWRAYSTGPDADVLIGPDFHPFYPQDRGKDLGVLSWGPDQWKIGGGTVWGFLSYDPTLDLVYAGTANPGPWNPDQRPGDNKWTAGIFARRPKTGQAIWAYQYSPHDLFDHDGVNEAILIDLVRNGQTLPVLVHPDRNGYVYVLDRASGEVLSAEPFVYVNSSRGVDRASGRLLAVEEKKPIVGKIVREICPAAPGAKDWQPSAFSPVTGLVYIPHNNLCQDEEGTQANYIAGTPYVGANVRYYAGPGGNLGAFTAWDPVAGKKVWSIAEKFPAWSGALATAGDLAFYGTMDGWFKAVHARTGSVLWQTHLPSGIIGQPVSYRGPDGKQYIAVLSGVGGWPGAIVSADLDTRDRTAGNGWGNAMAELPQHTNKGGTLYVFALP
jgi:PQQ-dependent dehydrogenase (methanol/ethanol family)